MAKWRATHLRTFRYGLWKHIKKRDLRGADGRWLRTAWDLAIMLPMLEMAGSRAVHIPDVLYVYDDQTGYNDHAVRPEQQKRDERWVRRLPKYQKVEVV
jgi:hypothetical protein